MALLSWRRCAGAALSLGLLGACARAPDPFAAATPLRAGDALPPRFEPPSEWARVAPADTLPGGACLSPMRDPRDGTELRMLRSHATRADYEVAPGRYGVGEHELLRLDCNTGQPLGIVRR
jgi:hypothetical protein